MDLGQTFTAEIHDIAFGGDGVCRTPDGMATFIPFTALGETVEVELVSQHHSFGRARLLRILSPSPHRVEPPCPYYGRCGGCQYQHLDYPHQLDVKASQLRQLLERIGKFEQLPLLPPPAPSPLPYGYRNKIVLEPTFTADAAGNRRVAYGFCRGDTKDIIEIEACPLAQPAINELLPRALGSASATRNASHPHPGKLLLRKPAYGTPFFAFGTPSTRHVLTERLLSRKVSVPAKSFWQVNPAVSDVLAEAVVTAFTANPTPYLIDAYAGAGTFSLAIGERAEQVLVIEHDNAALEAARLNHESWGLTGRKFHAESAEDALAKAIRAVDDPRQSLTVLIDPPRAGCSNRTLDALVRTPVCQLIYISCNPATLARDLRRLTAEEQYSLADIQAFDMFPQTAHFETLVRLVSN